ncbi:MAG: oxygen-independent coproporphyrinogen III oxidase [Gammaproteobacteria bacterium]|nr:oxygen-independent coproporphyrinogen III oxidase [Gammaproteobacteria bacterium]
MNPLFDAELIRRYDRAAPRYTSYPPATEFSGRWTELDYRQALAAGRDNHRSLSLYVHLPFCPTICYYCACNKIVTRDRAKLARYLPLLHLEIQRQALLYGPDRVVEQLHWGGGSPTFLDTEQMSGLMRQLRQRFRFLDGDRGEYSIEVDPRGVKAEQVELLRRIGFNRMSLGIQDLDPQVQKAVNRVQSLEETRGVVLAAKESGFSSISVDLIYGLPYQTVDGFSETLDAVVELSPDRLSLFNYAHLPELFKPQRRIDVTTLPSPEEKLKILGRAINHLGAVGYLYIGMDHFAKPEDELARAQQAGRLYRNFQGYSTRAGCDVVGLGVSAIGQTNSFYVQNHKTLELYEGALERGGLAVSRGYQLTHEDRCRGAIIQQLMCHFQIDKAETERDWGVDFDAHFRGELTLLETMGNDGLVDLQSGAIIVLPRGRLLIRNIAQVFDRYSSVEQGRFSRAV